MISLITFCIIVSQDDLLFGDFYSFILGGKKNLIGIVDYRDKGCVMGNRSRPVCVRQWKLVFYILKIHGEEEFKLIQHVCAQGNINNQYIISKSGEFLHGGLGYIVWGAPKRK